MIAKPKSTYFFLVPFLIPFLTFSQSKKISNPNIILWNKNYKLKWSDFRKKDSNDHKENAAAETCYSINYGKKNGENDTLIMEVETIFVKNKSFYDTTFINLHDSIFSREALQHEQIHFDIGEIYARKLRKDIMERLHKFKHKRDDQILWIVEKLYTLKL